ncbi:gamma-glutamyltransferase [Paraglaciecola sp.]|uniref:gamma-glutamyltransferase family protein n=1 Tax=Paraglaciecola sp. TaxID=1920173 RepID=UPI0030F41886
MTINSKPVAFTAPHYAASQVGQNILENGGTAVEAMVAAAASISVVYPHMNSIGGDGFWLISEPGKTPVAIDACGSAAQQADLKYYSEFEAIPQRGAKAALTMAGAVAGWHKALELSRDWQTPIDLAELLAPAIGQAQWGIEVTQSLQDASEKTFASLGQFEHFEQFLINGKSLKKGKILKLPKIAATFDKLAQNGLMDFYHGEVAKLIAEDLAAAGSPIQASDLADYQTKVVKPLSVKTSVATLYNLPAPTQGIASLLILALFDKVHHLAKSESDFIHLLVETTKQAFIVRNAYLSDSSRLIRPLDDFLSETELNIMAQNISVTTALPWPHVAKQGDTIWMGACDDKGRMVSYIQSVYWEFGSGVVLPQTGIVWNNRGTSFSLDPNNINVLQPGLKPFHTLNPAFADLNDGRRMVYGTMGGEGQPQTQAILFARHIYQQKELATSIAEGRWLLGRTWGDNSHNLKIEYDVDSAVIAELSTRGHDIAQVDACNELMGHAGAIVQKPDQSLVAATDPRSDGRAFSSSL